MAHDSEIQDYAKHLFFEDKSPRKIAKMISERYNKGVSHVTVKNWIDSNGWRAKKEFAQITGVMRVKRQELENEGEQGSQQLPLLGKDEILLEKLAKDRAKQYKESEEIRKIGLNLARITAVVNDDSSGKKKGEWKKDFDPKQLNAAVNAFKSGSEDMRKIEDAINKDDFDPSKYTDEELQKMSSR